MSNRQRSARLADSLREFWPLLVGDFEIRSPATSSIACRLALNRDFRGLCFLLLMCLLSCLAREVMSADLNLPPAEARGLNTYVEDFEYKDPSIPWASNGTYTVNYKGLTSEKSTSGRRCLKLDITFGTATFVYFRIPFEAFVSEGMTFRADTYFSGDTKATAAVGVQMTFNPPGATTHLEGYQNDKYLEQTNRWIAVSYDMASEARRLGSQTLDRHAGGATMDDVVPRVTSIGIFLFSKSSKDRVTLYLDNVELSMITIETERHTQIAKARWDSYQNRIKAEVTSLATAIPSLADQLQISQNLTYAAIAKEQVISVREQVKQRGVPDGENYRRLREHEQTLRRLVGDEAMNGPCSALMSVYPRSAISNNWPAHSAYPLQEPAGYKLMVRATPGEYEPTVFTVHAFESLARVNITVGDLKGDNAIIPSNAIDIRLVKYWYQAGIGTVANQRKRILIPELLLHDDQLIRIDIGTQTNHLRIHADGRDYYTDISSPNATMPESVSVSDAERLQDFAIAKGENKHVWITIRVPEYQKAGHYEGNVQVAVDGRSCVNVNLKLNVEPFTLEDPPITAAIYYRGLLNEKATRLTSEEKTKAQYIAELRNIRSHGIGAATVYDAPKYQQALALQRELGFRTDNALLVGSGTGSPKTRKELKALTDRVVGKVTGARALGYTNVYFYGNEELSGALVAQERETWKAVHRGGGRVFTAVFTDAVQYVGDSLDLAIVSGTPDKALSEAWHKRGKLLYSYSNPQAGVEEPETYRRNYGLNLWCAGYDGAIHYAYQHGFGRDIWNDFDHPTYRDHVFAYPTSHGVVDTIEWEGVREGIDDLRYLSALISANPDVTGRIKAEVCERVSSADDLSSIKAWMIEQIMQHRDDGAP